MNPFQIKSLESLLPYQAIFENILWMKDGSASLTLKVTPKSTLSFMEEELEQLRTGLTLVFNQLPEGAMLQMFVLREKSQTTTDEAILNWQASHASDDESAKVAGPQEELYRAKQEYVSAKCNAGEFYTTKIYLTLLINSVDQSPTRKTGPLSFIVGGSGSKKKTLKLKSTHSIALELGEVFKTFQISLEAQGFECESVPTMERLDRMFRHLNPERMFKAEYFQNPTAELANRLCLTDLVEDRRGLNLGRVKLRIGTLKNFPDQSMPSLLSVLSGLNQEFSFVLTSTVLNQTAEKEKLSRKQRLMTGLATGNAVRNLNAETQLNEIEDTLSSLISHGEKILVTSFHILTKEASSNTSTAAFESILQECERLGPGCQWFEETVGAHPVFFSTLPFAPTHIVRAKRVLSSTLTDFLPLYGVGPGHKEASVVFETPYQSLLGFSLYENSPSANAILIGSTGSGKSTLASGLLLGMSAGQNAAAAPSAFVIDVGNSFKRSILFLGGTSLDLSPEKQTRLNPFDLSAGETKPNPEKVKFLTALFDEILSDSGNLSKLERSLLETEVIHFYEEVQSERTLSSFRNFLEASSSSEMKRLAKLLSLWCQPHPYGLLFDGATNVETSAKYLHFELKGCQRYPDLLRVAMLVVMDLIWRQLLARFPRRSLVIVDEAHTIIRSAADGRANTSARWVEDCFRQMRKFSSAAIAISQTAKDLKSLEIGDGILANAPNRFILRQRGDEKTLREDLKLNESELADVFSLRQMKGMFSEFYLQSETIKGVFLYKPTPLELWLSTTHPPDNSLLDDEWKKHPELTLSEIMLYMAKTFPHGAEGVMADGVI